MDIESTVHEQHTIPTKLSIPARAPHEGTNHTLNSVDNDTLNPHVDVQLDCSLTVPALVDSGATCSLLSETMLKRLNDVRETKDLPKLYVVGTCDTVRVANGSTGRLIGTIRLLLNIGGQESYHTLHVWQSHIPLILGTNILRQGWSLDLGASQLTHVSNDGATITAPINNRTCISDSHIRLIRAISQRRNPPAGLRALSTIEESYLHNLNVSQIKTKIHPSFDNETVTQFIPSKDFQSLLSTTQMVEFADVNVVKGDTFTLQVFPQSDQTVSTSIKIPKGFPIGFLSTRPEDFEPTWSPNGPYADLNEAVDLLDENNNRPSFPNPDKLDLDFLRIFINGTNSKFNDIKNSQLKSTILNILMKHKTVFEGKLNVNNINSDYRYTVHVHTEPSYVQAYRLSPQDEEIALEHAEDLCERGIAEEIEFSDLCCPVVLIRKANGKIRFCINLSAKGAINDYSVIDRAPTLSKARILQAVRGRFRTLLDLSEAYHAIRLDENSRKYFAFKIYNRVFRLKSCAMGYVSSGAALHGFLRHTLGDDLFNRIYLYGDDLLISEENLEKHNEILEAILSKFAATGLKLGLSKLQLLGKSVVYLGATYHDDGTFGIKRDALPRLRAWPRPTTKKGVRSFLGFTRYFSESIPNFAEIAAPLVKLTRKNIRFNWDLDHEHAFLTLRKMITSAPLLCVPDFSRDFVLLCDASLQSVGSVLCQRNETTGKLHVIAYRSKALPRRVRPIAMHCKEALAVYDALQYFRPFISNSSIKIYTDAISLKYLRYSDDPKFIRWCSEIARFDCEIHHVAGNTHTAADLLSRLSWSLSPTGTVHPTNAVPTDATQHWVRISTRTSSYDDAPTTSRRSRRRRVSEEKKDPSPNPDTQHDDDPIEETLICSETGETLAISHPNRMKWDSDSLIPVAFNPFQDSLEQMISDQKADPFISVLRQRLIHENTDFPFDWHHLINTWQPYCPDETLTLTRVRKYVTAFRKLCHHDPSTNLILHKTGPNDDSRYLAPTSSWSRLLSEAHDGPTQMHGAPTITLANIRRHSVFPYMLQIVKAYVETCKSCAIKHPFNKPQKLRRLHPTRPFEILNYDFIPASTLIPETVRGNKHLLVVVCLFSSYCFLIPTKTRTAEEVSDKLLEHVFSVFGFPSILISDNESGFIEALHRRWCARLGITHLYTAPYRKQSSGAAERCVGLAKNLLRMLSMNDNKLYNGKEHWDLYATACAMALRTRTMSKSGTSPHEVVFGNPLSAPTAVPPVDCIAPFTRVTASSHDLFRYMEGVNYLINVAQAHLEDSHDAVSDFNRKRRGRRVSSFKVGQSVYVNWRDYVTKKSTDITICTVLDVEPFALWVSLPDGTSAYIDSRRATPADNPLPFISRPNVDGEETIITGTTWAYTQRHVKPHRTWPQRLGKQLQIEVINVNARKDHQVPYWVNTSDCTIDLLQAYLRLMSPSAKYYEQTASTTHKQRSRAGYRLYCKLEKVIHTGLHGTPPERAIAQMDIE